MPAGAVVTETRNKVTAIDQPKEKLARAAEQKEKEKLDAVTDVYGGDGLRLEALSISV